MLGCCRSGLELGLCSLGQGRISPSTPKVTLQKLGLHGPAAPGGAVGNASRSWHWELQEKSPKDPLVGRRKVWGAGWDEQHQQLLGTSPGWFFPPQAPSHPPELLPVEIKELGQAQPLSCVLGCISRCRAAFPGWSLSRNSVARKQERGGSCGGFCVSLLPRDTCGGSFQPSAPASRLRSLSERCLIAAAGIAEQEEQGIHPEC